MKKILGLDIGYGHTKVVFGTSDGEILKKFKFQSAVGVTKRNPNVPDNRIYTYKDHDYYIGDNAKALPSENRIDITEYKALEYYAPLFLYHALKIIDDKPDVIVAGLSIAQIDNSGYFKEALEHFNVNDTEFNFNEVYILPQGAGIKLAIDKYGTHFPVEQDEFTGNVTYICADIGFNTCDFFMVKNGKTSPALFEGIPKNGVMKIATEIAKKVYDLHNRKITLHEAEQILSTGVYKLRGKKYDFKPHIEEIKKNYLKDLLQLIENKYGKIIDQMDYIFISGGGASLFKSDSEDGFIRIVKNEPEFYNAIGQYLYGLNKS